MSGCQMEDSSKLQPKKGILDFGFYVSSDKITLFKSNGYGWTEGNIFLCFATLTTEL